ncbi:hypothetical protein GDO86_000679 [Hymenochirus boettgeri]|uniref:Glutathione S-transferase C-terminal domain-containing protein n=1 Tax=Hymenochirus boettgeri TaxID=247094 RepID=A0A8T2KBU2_9PIPI|nr:hypothetical protein GDO86_000679 [Hymenochirus boettgeri]
MKDQLYLDMEGTAVPLHTSIVLFLLSYCDCKIFRIFLVIPDRNANSSSKKDILPRNVEAEIICAFDLPPVVQTCRLPAVLEASGSFCRAGLAVILRHIIQKSHVAEPSRKDVVELLGFKKTCLKACAEVSQWTRLCEISIPQAVERFQQEPSLTIPLEVLQLEQKLGEPVRVHNDDKIRRQKLQELMSSDKNGASETSSDMAPEFKDPATKTSLEIEAALLKLTVQEKPTRDKREPSNIRKTKNVDLPPLEHVFAEGLYFTLTDVVLLPCIHSFLVSLHKKVPGDKWKELPLIAGWYKRVQHVPGVKSAAAMCHIHFIDVPTESTGLGQMSQLVKSETEGNELQDCHFIGGPRPTMTKLKELGIKAEFSPHPFTSWTIDWKSLPAAASPAEGKMSSDRALRKQQQLNNLLSIVTNIAKPGDTIVDFCSGGGHVGIVLAHVLPLCQVVLMKTKKNHLRAKEEVITGIDQYMVHSSKP